MTRRLQVAVAVLASIGLLLVPSAAEAQDSCHLDPASGSWVCDVVVDHPGNSGGTTPGNLSGVDPGACIDRASLVVPCVSALFGVFNRSDRCYYALSNPQPAAGTTVWEGHVPGDGAVYDVMCPNSATHGGTSGGQTWRARPPAAAVVTPEVLAQRALRRIVLPDPVPHRSPDEVLGDGRRYTVVRVPTWFWTDPGSYRPVSARVSQGGVWAQVTATPAVLTFTPGDGGKTAVCRGPGREWRLRDGNWGRAPGGCDYAYPRSTYGYPGGVLTATYGIRWAVSWRGSGGSSGSFVTVTSTSRSTFAVAEAQAVVIR